MSETPVKKLAVALAYTHQQGQAPRVIAKGEGHVADKIVETAQAHGVAVDHNPVLATALSQVELDEHIPAELYKAVAIVLTSVLRAAGKLPVQPASQPRQAPTRR